MPLISGNYDPAVGVLVQVAVIPAAQVAQLKSGQIAPTNLHVVMALVDTGASSTCVSKSAAQAAGLVPSGKTQMSGATGQGTVDQYTFGVGFIIGAQQTPTGGVTGSLNLHMVQGCEFTNHGFGFDVLLGRDVICKGGFSLTFDGHWALAF